MGISYQSTLHNISLSNPQVDGRFLDFLKACLQFLLVTSLSCLVTLAFTQSTYGKSSRFPNAVSHISA